MGQHSIPPHIIPLRAIPPPNLVSPAETLRYGLIHAVPKRSSAQTYLISSYLTSCHPSHLCMIPFSSCRYTSPSRIWRV